MKLGFMTTRLVESRDEAQAELDAVQLIRNDQVLSGVLNDRTDPPMIYCEGIEEIERFDTDSLDVKSKVPSSMSARAPRSSIVRQHMPPRLSLVALASVGLLTGSLASAADGLCKPLRSFLASVQPNEMHVLKFHTSWGANFKDDEEDAIAAKRCDHGGYEPAMAVCEYLMEFGAIEFSGNNAKSVISCLSPRTRFPADVQLHAISFSTHFGTENRGSLVDVSFQGDEELGGMVLTVTADGY